MQGTMHPPLCGKRPCQPQLAAVAGQTRYSKDRLLYAIDRNSGRAFLVDTGAEVSVFPTTPDQRWLRQPTGTLSAANGSDIPSYGTRNIPLQFGNRRFQWQFILAKVSQPLLGADFLRANNLMPDLSSKCLIDASDLTTIDCRLTSACTPHIGSVSHATDDFGRLLAEFPEVVKP